MIASELDAVWWLIAAVAFVAATGIARRVALATGFVAQPNKIVRTHRAPVPYLGGAALVVTLAALAIVGALRDGTPIVSPAVARAVAALALCALGVWDDRRALGPGFKMLAQLGICLAYLAVVDPPIRPLLGVKLLVLVTVINAYNLIDVMDGLLCLLAAIPVIGLLVTPDLAPASMHGELMLGLIGLAALFVFNAPPARIYAGDGGSLPLGFLVGAWCLAAAEGHGPAERLSILGLVAIPLLELSLLIVARMSLGLSPFRGSPDHYSLRLQDQIGWSKWQVLGATALVGAFFACTPRVVVGGAAPWPAVYTIAALALAGILWAMVWRIPPRRTGVTPAAPSP